MESLKQRIAKYLIEYKKDKAEIIKEIDEKSISLKDFKDNIIKNNIVSEEELILIFCREFRIPYLDLDKYRLPQDNKNLLPRELAFRYKVVPLSKIGDVLTVATANPLDFVTIDDLYLATSFKKICPVLALSLIHI